MIQVYKLYEPYAGEMTGIYFLSSEIIRLRYISNFFNLVINDIMIWINMKIGLLLLFLFTVTCSQNHRPETFRIIAHRGASAYAPENTIAGFQKAVAMGASWFELDVYLSLDGIPIVIHDETLDRTTNGKGSVKEKSFAELKLLDAGSWFDPAYSGATIPTLEQAMDFAKDTIGIYIEIKDTNPDLPQKIFNLVKEYEMTNRVVIQSFSLEQLGMMRSISRDITIHYLPAEFNEVDLQKAISVEASGINPSYHGLQAEHVEMIHRLDMTVMPYTVNDAEEVRRLLNIGVDGVITDKPDIARSVLLSR